MLMLKFRFAVTIICLIASSCVYSNEKIAMAGPVFESAPAAHYVPLKNQVDNLLAEALLSIQDNHLDVALKKIETLLRLHPDFRLAQLIHGDLLTARIQPLTNFGNSKIATPAIADLRDEARARLTSYLYRPDVDMVPRQLLELDPSIPTAIIVDTDKSRLYVFKNQKGELHNVADYYVTIGKNGVEKLREGDNRTPLGVYYITHKIEGDKLPDLYGSFAFPLNFPNDWDEKLGSFGHGIWLHGTTSATYSRPPKASSGCVVLTNNDLVELGKYITPNLTPVVIADHIKWVPAQTKENNKEELMKQVESWRHDWESRDTDRYIQHYAANFTANKTKFSDWANAKRRVNQGKTWIKVELSHVSVFEYPGQKNMYMISFEQNYRSNNLDNVMRKRQYWVKQNGNWKIVAENGA